MRENKMRRKMAESFLSALKEDIIPWERNWDLEEAPQNATTGNRYRGSNLLWLNYVAQEKGYSDPRWCTFNQAKKKGWRIKKGEKGTQIEYFSMYDREQRKTLTQQEADQLKRELGQEEYGRRVTSFTKNSTVFNGEQMEGIPARERKAVKFPVGELMKQRDVLLKNMNLKLEEGGDRASYSPSRDRIRMPRAEQFHDAYGYMATFLHEAAHATGHPTRLHREQSSARGTPGYAREELRAEIASAFAAQELGTAAVTEEQMKNHKAYIQDWIQILEKNPEELFLAVKEAQVISDYLIEKGEFHSVNLAEAIAPEQDVPEDREGTEKAEEIQKEPEKGAGKEEEAEFQKEAAGAGEAAMELEAERGKTDQDSPAESQAQTRKGHDGEEDREEAARGGRVELLGLYEWKGNDMVHYRKDGRPNITDGITVIEDADIMTVLSIPGIEETKGIDSGAFAEKVQWHHPELHFSEKQLKWIDRGTAKYSIIPPEENGIAVLGLYEKDGQEQYVHYAFEGEEYLSDGRNKHQGREKIRHILSGEDMERAAALDKERFIENLGISQYFHAERRLLDTLGTMEQDGAVRMPLRSEKVPEGKQNMGIENPETYSRRDERPPAHGSTPPGQGREGHQEDTKKVRLTAGYAKASEKVAAMILDRSPEVPLYCYSQGTSWLIREMPEEREGKVFLVNKNAFYGRKDFCPTITCELSESEAFEKDTIYSVSEFDALMESADRKMCGMQKEMVKKYGDLNTAYQKGTMEECRNLGYRKVKFTIDTRQGEAVRHRAERQDIGDGDGSVISFLSHFPSCQMEVQELAKQAEIERMESKLEKPIARDEMRAGQPKARAAGRSARRRVR